VEFHLKLLILLDNEICLCKNLRTKIELITTMSADWITGDYPRRHFEFCTVGRQSGSWAGHPLRPILQSAGLRSSCSSAGGWGRAVIGDVAEVRVAAAAKG
jgi:hypothetical protein